MIFFPVTTTCTTLPTPGFPDQDNSLIFSPSRAPRGLQDRLDAVVEDLPVVTVKDQAALRRRSSARRSTSSC